MEPQLDLQATDAARGYAGRRGGVVVDHIVGSGCGKKTEMSVDVPREGRDLSRYRQVVSGDLAWFLSPTLPPSLTQLTVDVSGWGPLRRLVAVGMPALGAPSCGTPVRHEEASPPAQQV